VNGILVTVLIVSGVNLLINVIYPYPWVSILLILYCYFSFNDFSYGQRATMVSFSALLAISLAFAHLQKVGTGFNIQD
jgi:hypothetical protein